MKYSYMTIGKDITEITYSKSYNINGIRCIDVCIETATQNDLVNVIVQMPFALVKKSYGMDNVTIQNWINFIKKNYTLINEMSIRNEEEEVKRCHKFSGTKGI